MPIAKLFEHFKPPKKVGRYRVEKQLGYGGMGIVYRARDPDLDRWVAIKFWLNESVGCRTDFLAEARLLARLNHPGVVQVFDVVDSPEYPAIVMEYVAGLRLDEYINKFAPGLSARLVIASSIAAGLVEAHAHGIVHRDLKLANVLITPAGESKITDFGIAGISGDDVIEAGRVQGSIRIMSPEQLRGEVLDERSDLFSFGCLLYWLFAERLPVQAIEEPLVILDTLAASTWPCLQRLCPDLPQELCTLVEQLLAFDQNSRPQSAVEVQQRIQGLIAAIDGWDDETATFTPSIAGPSRLEPASPVYRSAVPISTRSRYSAVAVMLFLVAVSVYYFASLGARVGLKSVALIPPTLQNPEHVRDEGLMKSAVFKAVADGMVSRVEYQIVMPRTLPLVNATPKDLAIALAVDELIYAHLDCAVAFCNISLRRHSGHQLLALADVRIPLESYVLMHGELVAAVGRLYGDTTASL